MSAVKTALYLTGCLALITTLYFIKKPKSKEVKLNFKPLDKETKHDLNLHQLPKYDYNILINISFHFKILNTVCNNESVEPLLLILVHSSSTNFLKRQLIRDTWGKTSELVKVAFLIGYPQTEETNEKLKVESYQNEDIVQGDFLDTYRNITYKHTMGLKYFIYHCPRAKYALKVDDDILVNISKMKKFLTEDISFDGAKDVLMCATLENARTLRSYRSKWRISFDEYPHRYFPTFCRGMAILYSPDILFNLYKNAQEMKKYVKLDDVFYTGITAEKIGFKGHSNIEGLISFNYKSLDEQAAISENLSSFLFIGSELNEDDILRLWAQLESDNKVINKVDF